MKFDLEGLEVLFPYDFLYPEQFSYMLELKRSLDAGGHCLLEMPTGTGKTVTLLSLITSYKYAHPDVGKLLYCTRTVPEMEKCLQELRGVMEYRTKVLGKETNNMLCVGLSARRNMCVHPEVSGGADRGTVDAGCRKLTASWIREERKTNPGVQGCEFYEEFHTNGVNTPIPPGVYSIDDMNKMGKSCKWCPYFTARHMVKTANVVVFNYQYLLDPKIAGTVSREFEKECIVVFDEAHNIDNVCVEALSVNIRQKTLDVATRNLMKLNAKICKFKGTNAARLQDEYRRLVQGLVAAGSMQQDAIPDRVLNNPAIPSNILEEAIPGNIRKAEHFVSFLRRFVDHLKAKLRVREVVSESPIAFMQELGTKTQITAKSLRFASERLSSLMQTLEIGEVDEFAPISLVADLGTLVSTYTKGFAVITEPFDDRLPTIPDPILQLSCLDSSLAIRPVFERFKSVVITSGTLSPIDLYPKLLGFRPVTIQSFQMTLDRNCFCPMIVTRGSDQLPLTTKFESRSDPAVMRNYGQLLQDMCMCVPDGMVCFFPSYIFMEEIVATWNEMGILQEVSKHKLIFIETTDVVETTLALENYKRACDCGRGAVFLSVARGKVAEGIDFDKHYGRAVILIGIPFQYTKSRILMARLEYVRDTFQVREGDFIAFDAIRQSSQCVGRVIRSKNDYGLMIFADKRYARHDKKSKLPMWITQHLQDSHCNVSLDTSIAISRQFLKEMAQPVVKSADGVSMSLWDEAMVLRQCEKLRSKVSEGTGGEHSATNGNHTATNGRAASSYATGEGDASVAALEQEAMEFEESTRCPSRMEEVEPMEI